MRAAVLLIVLVTLVIARARWRAAPDATDTSATPSAADGRVAGARPGPTPDQAPAAALRDAAARFAADSGRLSPGEWALLFEPPVLERGRLGAWDDYRVGSPVVLRTSGGVRGRGGEYRMWYLGCHLAMNEHRCGVGHATSADGTAWDKSPEPVFVPADSGLQDNLYEISVVRTGEGYWLFYSAAAERVAGRGRAAVHLATSPDGLRWADQGPVLDGESPNTLVIQQSVFHDGQRFHLWYVTPVDDPNDLRLLHLVSADSRAWTVVGGTALDDLRPDLAPIGRVLVDADPRGGFRALFPFAPDAQHTGDTGVIGSLVSPDGTVWRMEPTTTDPFTALYDDRGVDVRVSSVQGTHDGDGLRLWAAVVAGSQDAEHLVLAFRKED